MSYVFYLYLNILYFGFETVEISIKLCKRKTLVLIRRKYQANYAKNAKPTYFSYDLFGKKPIYLIEEAWEYFFNQINWSLPRKYPLAILIEVSH